MEIGNIDKWKNLEIPEIPEKPGNTLETSEVGKEKIDSLKKTIEEISHLIRDRENLSSIIVKDADKIKREITNFILEVKDNADPDTKREITALKQKQVEVSELQLNERVSCWKDMALLRKELRESNRELEEKEDRINFLAKVLD